MNKACKKCKRSFPEYMLDKYPNIFIKPICPLCGLKLTNKMFRKPEDTPFSDPDRAEVYEEAREYMKNNHKQNLGGYMINPPTNICPKWQTAGTGGIWVDLAYCVNCKISCPRIKKFDKMSNWERKNV